MKKINLLLLSMSLLVFSNLYSADNIPLIYKVNIKENIGSNTRVYLNNAMHEAIEHDASCLIIHMNTYGGTVLDADSMRTSIINFPIPTYVFIDNNAASAGALIAIACDSIFMRSSASIGAATVVKGDDGAKAPDKYQSYMRGMMRATAESNGKDTIVQNGDTLIEWRRDPLVAEAMVSESVVISGYVDSTQILTLTANQAMDIGYCDGIAENINQVIVKYLGFNEYQIIDYNPTLYDKIKGWLMNGVLQALLIMIIIGGIFFELQSPGMGFPSAIAITAAILYFTPLYLTGYAQSWEVLIFVLGLIFIVFEIFVIPGFGFAGISGIALVAISLILSLISNVNFDFTHISTQEIFRSSLIVSAGMGMGLVIIVYLSSKIGKPGIFRNIALIADQEGYISVPLEPASMIGKEGKVATVLRPSGKVLIDGEYYDAVSIKDYLETGDLVKVVRYENSQLYVIKK